MKGTDRKHHESDIRWRYNRQYAKQDGKNLRMKTQQNWNVCTYSDALIENVNGFIRFRWRIAILCSVQFALLISLKFSLLVSRCFLVYSLSVHAVSDLYKISKLIMNWIASFSNKIWFYYRNQKKEINLH